MNDDPSRASWVRLGEKLQERRAELGRRYQNRALFAQERGIDYRLSYDAEMAARTNYRRTTLRSIEVAYRWEPGSIDLVLEGGQPVTSESVSAAGRIQPDPGDPVELHLAEMVNRPDMDVSEDDLDGFLAAWHALKGRRRERRYRDNSEQVRRGA